MGEANKEEVGLKVRAGRIKEGQRREGGQGIMEEGQERGGAGRSERGASWEITIVESGRTGACWH